MSTLNKKDVDAVRKALLARKSVLLQQVRGSLAESGDSHYAEVLGHAPADSSDEALASSLADLSAARMDHEIAEYRALEAAEQRLDSADFGACVDCGLAIPVPRLLANPGATRCVNCQGVFERTHAGQEHGSL